MLWRCPFRLYDYSRSPDGSHVEPRPVNVEDVFRHNPVFRNYCLHELEQFAGSLCVFAFCSLAVVFL